MDFKTLTLQIINDSSIIENSNEPLTISVFDLLLKGGFMMIPIFILFIMSIYILFEKIFGNICFPRFSVFVAVPKAANFEKFEN